MIHKGKYYETGKSLFALFISIIFSASVYAQTTMEEFYADADRKANLEQVEGAGFLDQARTTLVAQCTEHEGPEQMDCECFETLLSEVSDQVLFYESIIAY